MNHSLNLLPYKLGVHLSWERFLNAAPLYCGDNKGWLILLVLPPDSSPEKIQLERIAERMGIWQFNVVKSLQEAKSYLKVLAKRGLFWELVSHCNEPSLQRLLARVRDKSICTRTPRFSLYLHPISAISGANTFDLNSKHFRHPSPPYTHPHPTSLTYKTFLGDGYIRSLPRRLKSNFPSLKSLVTKAKKTSFKLEERTPTTPRMSSVKFIPKIIHQFWIGGAIPPPRKSFMKSVERLAKHHGFLYKLWGNDQLNEDILPFSFGKIKQMFDYGHKRGASPVYSSIVDLMKYEIVCRFGGFSVDTNVEVQNEKIFMKLYDKTKHNIFVGANEDNCGWTCKAGGRMYLSAGFFGSIPNSVVMRNATNPKRIAGIDVKDPRANVTTGPMYLRKCIPSKKKLIALWPTSAVYPFNPFVDGKTNPCVHSKRHYPSDIPFKDVFFTQPCKAFPKSALMNHWVGGGTWH